MNDVHSLRFGSPSRREARRKRTLYGTRHPQAIGPHGDSKDFSPSNRWYDTKSASIRQPPRARKIKFRVKCIPNQSNLKLTCQCPDKSLSAILSAFISSSYGTAESSRPPCEFENSALRTSDSVGPANGAAYPAPPSGVSYSSKWATLLGRTGYPTHASGVAHFCQSGSPVKVSHTGVRYSAVRDTPIQTGSVQTIRQ